MNQDEVSDEATLLQRRLVQLESMVKDLQRECHRLRKQNKRLNSETQKFKKALRIRDDLLEGMHMERQGLKIENDWLKDQLKLVRADRSAVWTLNNERDDHMETMNVPSDTSDESEESGLEDNASQHTRPCDLNASHCTFLLPPTPVSTDDSSERIRRRRRYRHYNISTKDHHDEDSGSTSFATATDSMQSVQSQKKEPRKPEQRRTKSPIVSGSLCISSSSSSRTKPFDELVTGRNNTIDYHYTEDLVRVRERRGTFGIAGMNLVRSRMHTTQEYLSTRPIGASYPSANSQIMSTTSKITKGGLLVPRRLTQNVVTFPF